MPDTWRWLEGARSEYGYDAHVLHSAWLDGALFVADSYNGKVKRVDPVTRSCVKASPKASVT
jgi:hypothetical protein